MIGELVWGFIGGLCVGLRPNKCNCNKITRVTTIATTRECRLCKNLLSISEFHGETEANRICHQCITSLYHPLNKEIIEHMPCVEYVLGLK